MRRFLPSLKELKRYPSMIAGIVLIFFFVVVSLYAVIAIPYSEAQRFWADPSERLANPVLARPVWFDWFTPGKMPRTMVIGLEDEGATLTEVPLGDGMKRMEVEIPFEYEYDGFPSGLRMTMRWTIDLDAPRPVVSIHWQNPDGEQITLIENFRARGEVTYYISDRAELREMLGMRPEIGLFVKDPTVPAAEREPSKGSYKIIIRGEFGEEHSLDSARLTAYGQVHGLAGTDDRRRDLLLPLLWGAPIALAFGILAAIGAQMSTFVLAGIGTWFGGKLEKAFLWITQVNIVIPSLPILIMISRLYTTSIWTILGLVIALNIFSGSMLSYRAMFLQLKETPYFEAAQAYGASNMRIVFRYLLPKIAPTLLPQFVMIVPVFVFLETTLSVLGLGDPYLPTWGKMINDAHRADALYWGHYHWILQPSILLMGLGFGFALVGYALDRIFNPRLREL